MNARRLTLLHESESDERSEAGLKLIAAGNDRPARCPLAPRNSAPRAAVPGSRTASQASYRLRRWPAITLRPVPPTSARPVFKRTWMHCRRLDLTRALCTAVRTVVAYGLGSELLGVAMDRYGDCDLQTSFRPTSIS
jgi:hypothetical protein